MTPFEREYHLHEALDYHHGEVYVLGAEDQLLLRQDRIQYCTRCLGLEGEVEHMGELVQSVVVQSI